MISIFAIGLAGFLWIWAAPCALGGCAPLDDLAQYQAEGSELLDRNGVPFAHLATVDRRIVSLDSLPPYVPQAFVAIEDRRFYRHGGLDLWRTGGALFNNVKSRQLQEGGSTITQQLARNLFPDWLPYTERNLRRKILEARVARQIERMFSKDKILELYMNHIYLGSGAYGIEAASRMYFGKPASELTVAEAATLAGLPKAPSVINPKGSLERATERRNTVLDRMLAEGYIDETTAADAKASEIKIAEGGGDTRDPGGSYFVEQVRRELEERVGQRFYTAGLRIHTTFDPVIQATAEEELERQLTAIESGSFGAYRYSTYAEASSAEGQVPYLQGAVVVLDAESGEVRALVGGRDFADSKFNRATQASRQAGSAFKPFVYAAALQRYRSPLHVVEDMPLRVTMPDGEIWEPRNYTGTYDGPITMRDALVRSKNVATVRLALDVGIPSAVSVARDLGVTSEIPNVPAVALGAADLNPMELTAAYAAFGNGGDRVEPHLIREIVDRDGHVVWRAPPRGQRALDPAVAFVLTTMLRDAVDTGTGTEVRAAGFTGPAAGKTGTTNESSDAWFVGYTPDLVATVWIGLDQPTTIVSDASGGTLAAPVWGRMMRRIYATRPMPTGWSAPGGVVTAEVDRITGYVVNDQCPVRGPSYTEYFVRAAPAATRCPPYNVPYVVGDSAWIDDEWRRLSLDSTLVGYDSLRAATDWPELEALRRRVRRAIEEQQSDPLAPPVPGGIESPPAAESPAGVLGEPVERGAPPPSAPPPAEPANPRPPGVVPEAEAQPPLPSSDTAPRPLPRLLGVPTTG